MDEGGYIIESLSPWHVCSWEECKGQGQGTMLPSNQTTTRIQKCWEVFKRIFGKEMLEFIPLEFFNKRSFIENISQL